VRVVTKKSPWYRSLSAPSQIVLALFLGLCILFTVGLFNQADEYLAHRAQLEYTLARRAALEQTGRELRELEADVDMVLEGMVRDSRAARPGETVIQAPVEQFTDLGTEPPQQAVDLSPWQQWFGLFFGSD
jgi:hypothetical protein